MGSEKEFPRLNQSVAYATQARGGLTSVLQAEVNEGFLPEAEAISLAAHFMRENQAVCFTLEKKRAAIQNAYLERL